MPATPDTTLAHSKLEALKAQLSALGHVAVAYSGGVDSTFLLAVAHEVLGDQALAVTSAGHAAPARDIERTKAFCQKRGIRQVVVPYDELSISGFSENGPERCYHCKLALFRQMLDAAAAQDITVMVDGSNKDDGGDWRPGMRALAELGIGSPLREVGLTKAEIRALSREMGLPTWSMPSAACLASRIPYGERITAEKLSRVEQAEDFLHDLGFSQVRVRSHENLARIEVDADQIERLATRETREAVAARLKELGFAYVSLDLVGFRSGAMNEVLAR